MTAQEQDLVMCYPQGFPYCAFHKVTCDGMHQFKQTDNSVPSVIITSNMPEGNTVIPSFEHPLMQRKQGLGAFGRAHAIQVTPVLHNSSFCSNFAKKY